MIKKLIRSPSISILIVIASSFPSRSFGWGKDGHAAIVRLAFQLMPPAQRERLYAILDTTDPYYIGNWADWYARKEYPESKHGITLTFPQMQRNTFPPAIVAMMAAFSRNFHCSNRS